jgi:hypothetical protein
LDNGHIAEEGTYEDLIQRNGPFQRLIAEFGGQKEEQKEEDEAEEEGAIEQKGATPAFSKLSRKVMGRAAGTGKLEGRLMVRESKFRSITAIVAVIPIGIDGKPFGSPKDRLCTYQNMLQVPPHLLTHLDTGRQKGVWRLSQGGTVHVHWSCHDGRSCTDAGSSGEALPC